eukprot:PhM_4_TR9459/c0_g1_i2/m.5123
MCIAYILLNAHPSYPVLIFNNRDEMERRPTGDLHLDPGTGVACALDLEAGGTWMGVNTKSGVVAMLTNYRTTLRPERSGGITASRGLLVASALETANGGVVPDDVLSRDYNGYNLVTVRLDADGRAVMNYHTNGECSGDVVSDKGRAATSPPELHILCNSYLDDWSWPKMRYLRDRVMEEIVPFLLEDNAHGDPAKDMLSFEAELVRRGAALLCETPQFPRDAMPERVFDKTLNKLHDFEEPLQRNVYTLPTSFFGDEENIFRTVQQSVVIVKKSSISLSSSPWCVQYQFRRTHTPTEHDEWTLLDSLPFPLSPHSVVH